MENISSGGVEDLHHFIGPKHINQDGHKIDILYGCGGVLYRRWMLPSNFSDLSHFLKDQDIFHNDDLILSAYLQEREIPRLAFITPSVFHNTDEFALSAKPWKMYNRMWRAIRKLQVMGYLKQTEECSMSDSPLYKGLLLLIFVLIIFLLLIVIWSC